MEATKL